MLFFSLHSSFIRELDIFSAFLIAAFFCKIPVKNTFPRRGMDDFSLRKPWAYLEEK